MNKKEKIVTFSLCLVITVLLYLKYNIGSVYFFSCFLNGWLIISGWIDLRTQNVYRVLCLIASVIGIIFLTLCMHQRSYSQLEAILSILNMMIYFVFVIVQMKRKMYGAGDGFTFMSVSFYLAGIIPVEYFIFEFLLYHMILSNIIFVLFNLKKLDIKHIRMKGSEPFIPGIAGASIIFLLI